MASNSRSVTGTTSLEEGTSRKIKKCMSGVWEHFTKIKKEDGGKPNTAKCNYCNSSQRIYLTTDIWTSI